MSDTKVIPSPNHGDDTQTSTGPDGAGAGQSPGVGDLVQCADRGGAAGLPRRPPAHGAIRRAVARCAGTLRAATLPRGAAGRLQTSCQSVRSVPLRGEGPAGLQPAQVQALPRAAEPPVDAWKGPVMARWSPLLDYGLAGDRTTVAAGASPSRVRSLALRVACWGVQTEVGLRLTGWLWTSRFRGLCTTYTSWRISLVDWLRGRL